MCLKAQPSVINTKKKDEKLFLTFFSCMMNCTFRVVFRWTAFCLEHPLPSFFLPSFPSCFSPLFFKKVKKIRIPHTIITTRSFCRSPSKALKNSEDNKNNERSNFVTHRPSRDPNRELVLGIVLFRCVGRLLFFLKIFVSSSSNFLRGICDRLF